MGNYWLIYLKTNLWFSRSRISGSCGNFRFNFLRKCQTVSIAAAPFYSPISNVRGFQFLYVLSNTCYLLGFFVFVHLFLGDYVCFIAISLGVRCYLILVYVSSTLITWMSNIFSGTYWPFGTFILDMSHLMVMCVVTVLLGGDGLWEVAVSMVIKLKWSYF